MPFFRRAFMERTAFEEKHPEVGSRKWLIHQLDIQTSRIVRQRDRRCVTCGSMRSLQCSHFYSRRYLTVRFDLRNTNAMCSACNRRHNFDRSPYEQYMNDTYGIEVVAELDALRKSTRKVTDEDLRAIYEARRAA